MREKTYRPAKRWAATGLAAVLVLLAVWCSAALYARQMLLQTLGGRQIRRQEQRVTAFSLREQMMQAQADTRVRGWLSMAEKETAEIRTQRGMLRASLFHPVADAENAPWALVLHGGIGTDRNQVLDVACMLSLHGYWVLTPDLYAHGESDGTVSSLGLADAQDVQAWCAWMTRERGASRIVLFGQDEGGYAALLAAAKGLPGEVRAVAADSAYSSISERLLDLLYAAYGKESRLQSLMLFAAYRLTHGMGAEGELMQVLSDCELPLLIIHGTGDTDVPAWHGEDIAAAGKNARLLFAEGAAHGMARYAMGQSYEETLLHFFDGAIHGTTSEGKKNR